MIIDHLEWAGLPNPLDAEIDVNRHVLDETLVAHDHDFVEVAVVSGGSAVHETLYGERRIGRGDAFVIRPGAWHAYRHCAQLAVVNCCFQARLVERELHWLAGEPGLRLLLWPGRGTDDGVVPVTLGAAAVAHLHDQLELLATRPAEMPRPYRIAHLLLLLRTLACELDVNQLAESERLAATPAAITDAVRLLTDDIARPWLRRGARGSGRGQPCPLLPALPPGHRPTADRPPHRAPRRGGRGPAAAEQRIAGRDRGRRRLGRPELLRPTLPGALRGEPERVPLPAEQQ